MAIGNHEQYNRVHTEVGLALAKLAGYTSDEVRTGKLSVLRDNLNDRLAITPIKTVSDLYDVIHDSVEAVKKDG